MREAIQSAPKSLSLALKDIAHTTGQQMAKIKPPKDSKNLVASELGNPILQGIGLQSNHVHRTFTWNDQIRKAKI